jgi:hypothetical protein
MQGMTGTSLAAIVGLALVLGVISALVGGGGA